MAEKMAVLVCRVVDVTSEFDDHDVSYASIELNKKACRDLLKKYETYKEVAKKHKNLLYLELWNSWTAWCASIGNFDETKEAVKEGWCLAKGYTEESALPRELSDERLIASTIKVTDTGVLWETLFKYRGGSVQTPEISYEQLEKIVQGSDPAEIFPCVEISEGDPSAVENGGGAEDGDDHDDP